MFIAFFMVNIRIGENKYFWIMEKSGSKFAILGDQDEEKREEVSI